MIKPFKKMGIKETYFNIVKGIYETYTANVILSGEKLKAFSLRSETRQGCPHSPIFNIVLEVLAMTIRKMKRNKRNPDQKRRSKTLTVCR